MFQDNTVMGEIERDNYWSWIIAFACCVCHFMLAGTTRMSGLLLVHFRKQFEVKRSWAALPFTLNFVTGNFVAPVTGYLAGYFGFRLVISTACILGSLGVGLCFLAKDVFWATAFWGVLFGLGYGLGTALLPHIINQHFEKYKSTASGISFSGIYAGALILPLIFSHAIEEYGFSGAFLILSGVMLHSLIAATAFEFHGGKNNVKKTPRVSEIDNEDKKVSYVTELTSEISLNPPDECIHCVRTNDFSEQNINGDSSERVKSPSSDEEIADVEEIPNPLDISNKQNGSSCSVSAPYTEIKADTNSDVISSPNAHSEVRGSEYISSAKLFINSCRKRLETYIYGNFHINNGEKRQTADPENIELQNHASDGQTTKNDLNDPATIGNGSETPEPTELKQHLCLPAILYLTNHSHAIANEENGKTEPLDHGKYTPLDSFVSSAMANRSPDKTERVAQTGDNPIWSAESASSGNNTEHYNYNLNSADNFGVCIPSRNKKDGIDPENLAESKVNSMNLAARTSLRWAKLFTDPAFLTISGSMALHYFVMICIFTIIEDLAQDLGTPLAVVHSSLMALSAADLLGALCLGWVTDKGYMKRTDFLATCFTGRTLCTIGLIFCKNYSQLLVAISLFGFLNASAFTMFPLLVDQYMEKEKHVIAIPSLFFPSMPISMFVPLVIGYFRDHNESYVGLLCLLMAVSALCSIVWVVVPRLWLHDAKQNDRTG